MMNLLGNNKEGWLRQDLEKLVDDFSKDKSER